MRGLFLLFVWGLLNFLLNLIDFINELKMPKVKCKIREAAGIKFLSHDLACHVWRKHGIKVIEYKREHGEIRSDKYKRRQAQILRGM